MTDADYNVDTDKPLALSNGIRRVGETLAHITPCVRDTLSCNTTFYVVLLCFIASE